MLQTENIYIFLIILPVVSFLYASVGHGGASGYLALMALFSFAPESMKPTALLLKLIRCRYMRFTIIIKKVSLTRSYLYHLQSLLYRWPL